MKRRYKVSATNDRPWNKFLPSQTHPWFLQIFRCHLAPFHSKEVEIVTISWSINTVRSTIHKRCCIHGRVSTFTQYSYFLHNIVDAYAIRSCSQNAISWQIRFAPGWRTTLFVSIVRAHNALICGDTKTVTIRDLPCIVLRRYYWSFQASQRNNLSGLHSNKHREFNRWTWSTCLSAHYRRCLDQPGGDGFQKQFSTAPGIKNAVTGTFSAWNLITLTSNKLAHSPMVYARPFGLCIAFTSGSLTHHSYHTFLPSLIRQNCTASWLLDRTKMGSCNTNNNRKLWWSQILG